MCVFELFISPELFVPFSLPNSLRFLQNHLFLLLENISSFAGLGPSVGGLYSDFSLGFLSIFGSHSCWFSSLRKEFLTRCSILWWLNFHKSPLVMPFSFRNICSQRSSYLQFWRLRISSLAMFVLKNQLFARGRNWGLLQVFFKLFFSVA